MLHRNTVRPPAVLTRFIKYYKRLWHNTALLVSPRYPLPCCPVLVFFHDTLLRGVPRLAIRPTNVERLTVPFLTLLRTIPITVRLFLIRYSKRRLRLSWEIFGEYLSEVEKMNAITYLSRFADHRVGAHEMSVRVVLVGPTVLTIIALACAGLVFHRL